MPLEYLLKSFSMTFKIFILPTAEKDLNWYRNNDKKLYIKSFDLIRAISKDPRTGIGFPERLKYFKKEVYSRRINKKARIIYTIYQEDKTVDISSCKGHYD